MQLVFDMGGERALLREADRRLNRRFHNLRPRYRLLDPVSQLVMSLLGGLTYGPVSRAAHARLVRAYADWSDVRDAPLSEIEAIIRPVTNWQAKASRLQGALAAFADETGEPCLDWLAELSVAEGHRALERITGIGPKTAAAVLNTSTLRKRSVVIDTHHLRILKRLDMLRPQANFVEAYRRIMPLIPKGWDAETVDRHHMVFKYLGQTICRPEKPLCHICPLIDLCPAAEAHCCLAIAELGSPGRPVRRMVVGSRPG